MAPKLFSLSEANALLPTLEPLVRRLVEVHAAFLAAKQGLESFRSRASLAGGVIPPPELRETRAEMDRLAAEIREGVGEVEALGCVFKDLESGLVDFLSLRQREHVFLCWRLGEPTIRYWHGLDEGFAGRKPIQG